jgi:uncharacterized protein (TIGR04255 family)
MTSNDALSASTGQGASAEFPFPSSERVIYRSNPLTEVVCQLRFPPILKIDTELASAFQERLRGQYPVLRERVNNMPELLNEAPAQVAELLRSSFSARSRRMSYDFVSSDDHWTVGLTREFISLSTRKYEKWEAFRGRLAPVLDALVDIYRPSFFTRVGLRYQDFVQRSRLGLEEKPWADLLCPYVAGLLSATELNAEVAATFTQASIRLGAAGQVNMRHGLVLAAESHETCYLLDFDFFTDERIEIDHAFDRLDFFNRQSGRLFRWCIRDILHYAMGPEPVVV